TGLLFSVVFARQTMDIGKGIGSIYASDLLGGSLACMAIVPLLNFIGGPNAILFSSLAMAAAAIIWSERSRARIVSSSIAAIFALLIAANYSGKLIDIIYAKGMRRD